MSVFLSYLLVLSFFIMYISNPVTYIVFMDDCRHLEITDTNNNNNNKNSFHNVVDTKDLCTFRHKY